jgi:hypothetical protein
MSSQVTSLHISCAPCTAAAPAADPTPWPSPPSLPPPAWPSPASVSPPVAAVRRGAAAWVRCGGRTRDRRNRCARDLRYGPDQERKLLTGQQTSPWGIRTWSIFVNYPPSKGKINTYPMPHGGTHLWGKSLETEDGQADTSCFWPRLDGSFTCWEQSNVMKWPFRERFSLGNPIDFHSFLEGTSPPTSAKERIRSSLSWHPVVSKPSLLHSSWGKGPGAIPAEKRS